MSSQQAQSPAEATCGRIPARQENVQALIAEFFLVPGLLDERVNEHVTLLILVFCLLRL